MNGIFFKDLKLADPEVYLDAVGDDLGATMGNIIDKSYKLMVEIKPDAVLVLGDTNSCLSVISAKRLHIPIFHMEAGNRCFDECLPEETNRRIVDIISDVNICYSEHARRYLNASSVAPQRTYVSGSPMAEVLHENLTEIETSDVHERLGLKKGKYILLSATGRRISIQRRTLTRSSLVLMLWQRNMICQSCTVVIQEVEIVWRRVALSSIIV